MLPGPREVLGKTGLGEKLAGTETLLVLRVRNESSVSDSMAVLTSPETEDECAKVELLLTHLSKVPYFA